MKFELSGKNSDNCKILLDGNPVKFCQSIDFHMDVNTNIPVVKMELIPTEESIISLNGVETYIKIGTKTYKLIELEEE